MPTDRRAEVPACDRCGEHHEYESECPLPPELSDDLDGFMSGMGGVFS